MKTENVNGQITLCWAFDAFGTNYLFITCCRQKTFEIGCAQTEHWLQFTRVRLHCKKPLSQIVSKAFRKDPWQVVTLVGTVGRVVA